MCVLCVYRNIHAYVHLCAHSKFEDLLEFFTWKEHHWSQHHSMKQSGRIGGTDAKSSNFSDLPICNWPSCILQQDHILIRAVARKKTSHPPPAHSHIGDERKRGGWRPRLRGPIMATDGWWWHQGIPSRHLLKNSLQRLLLYLPKCSSRVKLQI